MLVPECTYVPVLEYVPVCTYAYMYVCMDSTTQYVRPYVRAMVVVITTEWALQDAKSSGGTLTGSSTHALTHSTLNIFRDKL